MARLEPQHPIADLAEFREWARSEDFPERGRIDYIAGGLEVDMSPEDLYTHGTIKLEIAAELHARIARPRLGSVFVDRCRFSSPAAQLSVEPDVAVVLWESIDGGRVRPIPSKARRPGRYIEIEGAPDLVVEVVSDGSVRKDRHRLPPLYAAAGVPELWLVDARKDEIGFEIHVLGLHGYEEVPAKDGGWRRSPLLGARIRMARERVRPDHWTWWMEVDAGADGYTPTATAG